MIKQLNNKQREFLEYLRDSHNSLGWTSTIDTILRTGSYETDNGRSRVPDILKAFGELKKGDKTYTFLYRKPTKYLK